MIHFFRTVVFTGLITALASSLLAQNTSEILDKRVSIDAHDLPVKEILKKISDDTGIGFSYSDDLVSLPKRVTISVSDKPLNIVLDQILSGSNIVYQVIGNQVVFRSRKTYSKKVTISGYVSDSKSSERLMLANVYDSVNRKGTISNAYGFYSISLPEGWVSLFYTYVGYPQQKASFRLLRDTVLNCFLEPNNQQIKEVQVVNSKTEAKLSRPQTGLMKISSKEIKKMPVLLGEADVMRALQTLPGIQAANERSTGISVRGGSIDQNLYLLDDAPIFQISHMIGLYSVFNTDAIKDVKIYKGDIPANYGGRLSSLLDIRLKDGNMQEYEVSGGVGFVATNLSIEGPIVKNRISFIVSGKHSYIGTLFKLTDPNIKINFYDLNCKLNAIISNKSRLYISSYNGGDNASINLNSNYHNNTLSLRWNYVYNPKLFSNISLIYSDCNFKSGYTNNKNENLNYTWRSGIKQTTLKAEYSYYLNSNNTIDFGASTTYNDFIPGKLEGNRMAIDNVNLTTPFSNRVVHEQGVLDHAVYISNQQKITDKLSFRYGVRASLYQNIGGHWIYKLTNYQVSDSFYVSKHSTYANYFSVEPRISMNYRLFQNSSIKASYTYSAQQTQLLTKTAGGGPLDVWFPSGVNIKPQTSSQYSLGYVHYIFNNSVEASIDGYYKKMHNIVDYKDGATFLKKSSFTNIDKTSYNFEEELRTGKGYAYGVELMLKGEYRKIDGYMCYTYARSFRKISGINLGETYLSPFDRPHTFDIFLNFNITKRLSLSTNFRYQSGQVATVPVYSIEIFGKLLKGYSKRNSYRLPYYQRLDISLTIKNKEKPGKLNHGEWNFSVINALLHANVDNVDFIPSEETPNIIEAKGTIMPFLIPSISYHFKF